MPDPHTVSDDGVSVVVPAYDEEHAIEGVLQGILGEFAKLDPPVPVEVIVVDDGSRDRTNEVVRRLAHPNVQLVEHANNRGYGAALKTGVARARYPWVLITDADGTYPDAAIGTLVAQRAEHHMVVGARTGPNAHVPWVRRAPKWVLRQLASYLSRVDIPDLNSGLRLMRRDVIQRFVHILPNSFSFTATITLAMLSSGYRVKYVPIDYFKRTGSSKIHPIYDTLNFLQLIIRTVIYFDPLRVFLPLSLLFLGSSVAVGVGSVLFLERFLDATTVLLFVTGIQTLAIGILADLVNKRAGSG